MIRLGRIRFRVLGSAFKGWQFRTFLSCQVENNNGDCAKRRFLLKIP
jgi:hypothetical protein